ncbi:MAG TPA: zf-HC2 domain-containing protein [Jatrophihabitans sp.]|nr:zf-HC2 domain-containing protein [Jatrophihabitans sp.]
MTTPGSPAGSPPTGGQRPGDEHDRFALDDAAYLLGGLDPAGRAAYEAHLAGCPRCQHSVTDLAGLPGLLERVDPASLVNEPPPQTLLPRLLADVDRARARSAWRTAAAAFAAACLLVALTLGAVGWYRASHQPVRVSLQAVGVNPFGVHASVQLLGPADRPRLRLDCGYRATPAGYPPGSGAPVYQMRVYNRQGSGQSLGEWTPQPGEDVQLVRDSPWPRSALARIEITDGRGVVLLAVNL